MVKVPRLLTILVIGGILANGASASDDLAATQPISSQDQSTGTQTTQVQTGSAFRKLGHGRACSFIEVHPDPETVIQAR